jgi:asparagine synthase (glutamine-hydrolysing)
MSGFFGIFSPGGKLDLLAFDQMKSAIHRNGYDELETFIDDNIAMGHLMLRVTPESVYDKQPLKSDCGRYILVGHFRLDYRDELGDKLGLTQMELEQIPDSSLVMKSYQKWRDKCVHHLEGDWAFALYDMLHKVFFFAKDPTGISALFYTILNQSLYFSADPTVFSKSQFFPLILDEAQFVYFSLEGLKINKGSTLLKNLKSLQNGFLIKITSSLMESQYAFFDLSSGKPQKKYRYDIDVAFDFKSIYFDAVKSRCRSLYEIGLFLSAGLDSMSVAEISSSELKNANRKLNTFTSVPSLNSKLTDKEKQFADESSLVQIFNSRKENLQSRYLSFDNFEFSKINLNELRKDPFNPSVTLNTFWINGILQEAQKSRIRLMMTGQMGNFTISSDGYLVHIEMLFRLNFYMLYKEINQYASKKNISFFEAFRIRVIKVLVFNIKSWLRGKFLFLKNIHLNGSSFTASYLVNKEFKKKKIDSWVPGSTGFFSNRVMRVIQLQKSLYFGNIYWYGYGSSHGVDITDPTSDFRVIDFSLRITDSYFNKYGITKFLYKLMFAELIPREIIENGSSLVQSFDFGDRLKIDSSLNLFVKKLSKDIFNEYGLVDNKNDVMIEQILSNCRPNYKRGLIMKFLHNVSVLNYLLNFKKN